MQNSLNFVPRCVNRKRKPTQTTTRARELSQVKQPKFGNEDSKEVSEIGNNSKESVPIRSERGSSKQHDERKTNQDKSSKECRPEDCFGNNSKEIVPKRIERGSSKQHDERKTNQDKSSKECRPEDCFGKLGSGCATLTNEGNQNIQTISKQDPSHITVLSAIENQDCPPYKDIGCLSPRKHIAVYKRQTMTDNRNRREYHQEGRINYSTAGQYNANVSRPEQFSDQQYPIMNCTSQSSQCYSNVGFSSQQHQVHHYSNMTMTPHYSGQHNSSMCRTTHQYEGQHYSNVSWTPQYYQESTRRPSRAFSQGYSSRGRHQVKEELTFGHPREWEYTGFGYSYIQQPARNRRNKFDFTVMSYNVLSQDLLEDNSYLYSHCPEHVLDWNYRKTLLLKEIKAYNPDVLCLQEVNSSHYDDFFVPELTILGYIGNFVKRTGDKKDGCATFYKKHKFTLDEAITINYKHPKGGEVLDRDNVALILKLIPKLNRESNSNRNSVTSKRVCISNTHILFNPRRGDVKLAQLMMLLAELDKCGYLRREDNRDLYHGLVMCGDFNLEPQSDLYQLLAMGRLDYIGLPRTSVSGQEYNTYRRHSSGPSLDRHLLPSAVGINDNCQYCEIVNERNKNEADSDDECKVITNVQGTGILSHQLKLLSAYTHRIARYGRTYAKEVTTHHGRADCTVDYIFYGIDSAESALFNNTVRVRNVRESALRLIGRYGLLSSYEIDQMGSLPNKELGSDHLCLMARFVLT